MPKFTLYEGGEGFGFQTHGIRFGTTQLTEWAAKRGADIARGYFDTKGPNGSWSPIHVITKRRKGSSNILINNRDLVNSIQAVQVSPRRWAVMTDNPIAPYHEYGAAVKVTKRMRKFLHVIGIHLSEDTEHIVIPRRAFMKPAADQLERELDTIDLGKFVPLRGVERLI